MPYCPNCGLSVSESATYCQICGTSIDGAAAGPSASAPPTQSPPAAPPTWATVQASGRSGSAGGARFGGLSRGTILVVVCLAVVVVGIFVVVTWRPSDKYTGKWMVTSVTENGAPSPAPTPAVFINVRKSGDAGGDHDVWFTQKGTTPLDHLGMYVAGDHLESGGSGPSFTITVHGGTLTMTSRGYNYSGAAVLEVDTAVRK